MQGRIVSNTGPIIALAGIAKLEILNEISMTIPLKPFSGAPVDLSS